MSDLLGPNSIVSLFAKMLTAVLTAASVFTEMIWRVLEIVLESQLISWLSKKFSEVPRCTISNNSIPNGFANCATLNISQNSR